MKDGEIVYQTYHFDSDTFNVFPYTTNSKRLALEKLNKTFLFDIMGCISLKQTGEALAKLSNQELRHRVCWALVEEIETWVAKTKAKIEKNPHYYCPEEQLQEVLHKFKNEEAPWRLIKQTKDSRFIDECAYLCIRVRYELPQQEKDFMDMWLANEGFYDTVN